MNEAELRSIVSQNIVEFRKKCNMTQADLAEKLSYSDKSVSKWERGDGVPDIYVLTRMAELFGVTVNDIIGMTAEPPKPEENKKTSNHLFVSLLSVGLVWFLAVLVFFIARVSVPDEGRVWLTFIYALPISAIVVTVFSHLWWSVFWRAWSVSYLVWSSALCFHLTASIPQLANVNLIYTVAGAFEVLVIVWYINVWLKNRENAAKSAPDKAVEAKDTANSEAVGSENE